MSRFFAIFVGLFVAQYSASALSAPSTIKWTLLHGHRYISQSELEKLHLKIFVDSKKNRVLVEGQKKAEQAIFLIQSPYALIEGKFLDTKSAMLLRNGKLFVPIEILQSYLLSFSDKKEVILTEMRVLSEVGNAFCSEEHPVKKIFIDPGHGGSDFGAGFEGVFEKNVVLLVAKLLAIELRKYHFELDFSRTKDLYLPLDIRSALAKDWKADAFISIHMNSAPAEDAHGTETYILSTEATDADARKLALAENTIPSQMKDDGSPLKDILWDMEQTSYLQESAYLASSIQKSIIATQHALKNRGVRQAPFSVLSRAAMPAVLVELGYLSNSRERKLFQDKKNLESLAKALAEGVRMYSENCKKK